MKKDIDKFFSIGMYFLVICLVGFSFYSQAEVAQAEDISEVKLEVHAPFSIATITIDNQGNIYYSASSPDTGIDRVTDSMSITPDQYNELVYLININDFFSLEEKYIEDNLADATSYTVTVKKGDQTKSVSCYGKCPDQVRTIIDKIKGLWGKEILEVGV